MSTAALVRGYREQIQANPTLDYSDATYWLVNETPDRTWTPSQVARALDIYTGEARGYLDELAANGDVLSTERGAWSRYSSAARR